MEEAAAVVEPVEVPEVEAAAPKAEDKPKAKPKTKTKVKPKTKPKINQNLQSRPQMMRLIRPQKRTNKPGEPAALTAGSLFDRTKFGLMISISLLIDIISR